MDQLKKNVFTLLKVGTIIATLTSVFTSIQKEIYECIAKEMSGNALDVGCGSGRIMAYMKNNPNIRHYTGVDLSKEMIEQAKWLKHEFNFTRSTFLNTNIEFLNKQFDSIVSIHSYYAWQNKASDA